MENSVAQLQLDSQDNNFYCLGSWSVLKLDKLLVSLQNLTIPAADNIMINGSKLQRFDSAGALALREMITILEEQSKKVELVGFNEQNLSLFNLILDKKDQLILTTKPTKRQSIFYRIGKEAMHKLDQANGFIVLVGELSIRLFYALGHWRYLQLPSIISVIETAGIQALPIIALLAFLIGVVLAYQMGLQLQTYGANIFIAYLSGMAIFREFGPLIAAIIAAGRTSSAFTAQIGSMKVNEEVDALCTMGLSPIQLLVMPKVLGLLIFFPLLIFWADIFSVLGSMVMSKAVLGISYLDFLARLKDSVGFSQLKLGLYKAPAFAILIALVGCYQGFQVEASADSIGRHTTKSVVQALFLIIIADAAYSIIYSWLGL